MSCPSATACTAVGYFTNRAGNQAPLAERWNGTSWAIQTTPDPTGASQLSGVSCASATACTAVGYYENGAGHNVTLAEHWNGTTWTIQTTANPTGASASYLSSVSCTSATACTAVGHYLNSTRDVTLAERWNGTTWVVQATPNPTGVNSIQLTGVSCWSATGCTAVGRYLNSGGQDVALEESWKNGTTWTIQTTPDPPGATASYLSGVSCSSARACTAVGYYITSSGQKVTLAEWWNGTSWTIQTTPNPTGATASYFTGVSCTSSTVCTAVGSYSDGQDMTLAERRNGTTWTIQPTPNPKGNLIQLTAVSCKSLTACATVGNSQEGDYLDVTLAERWNGTTWAIQPTPNPAGATNGELNGVSCTSATACDAVGAYVKSSGQMVTLAERWNGRTWATQMTPNPTGEADVSFTGVSCTSTSLCTAVGDYYNAGGSLVTLAERWDGSSWMIQATPNAAPAFNALRGVSCPSATECTAVGYYQTSGGADMAWAERWNGTTWTIQTTPNPTGATASYLSSVSCTSPAACTATGHYTDSGGHDLTLAERWNGTTWTIQTTPTPAGTTISRLSGVSCTSASACTTAGYYENSAFQFAPLAERWNGAMWVVQTTPNPTGTTDSQLSAVSCKSSAACTAVGFNDSATLAERWNGTSWAIQTTPDPTGASQFSGVSCASTNACAAVGGYSGSSPNVRVPFAEGYTG